MLPFKQFIIFQFNQCGRCRGRISGTDHGTVRIRFLHDGNRIIKYGVPENIYRRKAFLYSVLGELEENTAYLSATRGRDEVMTERILAYIDENYTSPDCDLKALSTHLGYDYTYVSKFFSANLSVGFRRFMNLYRIHKAQLLLREEDVTVTEAALSVGYSSVRNFNYEFLSITGMTPGEYRRGERK